MPLTLTDRATCPFDRRAGRHDRTPCWICGLGVRRDLRGYERCPFYQTRAALQARDAMACDRLDDQARSA